MLDGLTEWAPKPLPRQTDTREVKAEEEKFSGFVLKFKRIWIQNTVTASPLCVFAQVNTAKA